MEIVIVFASMVAAIASAVGVVLAWQQRRATQTRRLTELNELVAEIRRWMGYGTHESLRRDVAQERLRMQLGGDTRLPATREFAYARLRSDDESSAELAAAAGAELDRKLGITERRLVGDRVTE